MRKLFFFSFLLSFFNGCFDAMVVWYGTPLHCNYVFFIIPHFVRVEYCTGRGSGGKYENPIQQKT